MTALVVILCIVLFFAFLFFMPISLRLKYNDDVHLTISYLFFKFTLLPEKPKKKTKSKIKKKTTKKSNKKEDEKKDKEEGNFFSHIFKEKGLGGIINFLKELLSLFKNILSDVSNHIIIKRFSLSVLIASDNAADTAINYGYACSAIYPTVSAITSMVKKCKISSIQIAPDFDKKETKIKLDFKIKIKVYFLIKNLLKNGLRLGILFIKEKSNRNHD